MKKALVVVLLVIGLVYTASAQLQVQSAVYQFNHISTIASTQVKTGEGWLHLMTINTTAAGAVTLYDNTACSGTQIAAFAASAPVGTYTYDVEFQKGLCVVTAAASDLTVSFR